MRGETGVPMASRCSLLPRSRRTVARFLVVMDTPMQGLAWEGGDREKQESTGRGLCVTHEGGQMVLKSAPDLAQPWRGEGPEPLGRSLRDRQRWWGWLGQPDSSRCHLLSCVVISLPGMTSRQPLGKVG